MEYIYGLNIFIIALHIFIPRATRIDTVMLGYL